MDIKDQWQVCSLELSKRLKELGYPQKSLWWWSLAYKPEIISKEKANSLIDGNEDGEWTFKDEAQQRNEIFSAPSVAELGMELPDGMQCNRIDYKDGMKEWHSWAWNFKPGFFGNTEANARGLMWKYLKKNGLLKEKNG